VEVMARKKRHHPPQQQGQQANSNGEALESDIAHRLLSAGYLDYRPAKKSAKPAMPDPTVPYFIRQCRNKFDSIYGTQMIVDFYLWHPDKHPDGLIIEAKYQEEQGSVDSKFPYLVQSLKKTNTPALVLLIGPGARPEAVRWCEAQQHDSFIVLTSWEAFVYRCNRGYF
jgi:hypothetical protein